MDKFVSAEDAVALIGDGATVAISGLISMVVPEKVIKALGKRFRETASPSGLTLVIPNRPGWKADPPTGLEHLAQPGMIKRAYGAIFSRADSPNFMRMAESGEIETYAYPMGCLYRLIRELASGSPGFLTEVGLNTYADPTATDSGSPKGSHHIPDSGLVRRIDIDGKPYLFYKTFPIHVAIIRGTAADPDGNISMEGEPVNIGVRAMAMAVKNAGGIVIAQVNHAAERGSLHPRLVEVPGMLVDAVVIDPDGIQSQLGGHDPSLTGQLRRPTPVPKALAFDERKLIARRAMLEIRGGEIVNLGIGIGTGIPSVAHEEGVLEQIVFSLEHGAIGGIPAMGTMNNSGAFGAHYNPSSIVDSTDIFDFYHGGGLDATVLGFAQIDSQGNVNVGRIAGALRGPGGFIDIAHKTKKVLFCGTLTAGGLDIEINSTETPSLRIRKEGRNLKFVPRVDEVNFHGPTAVAKGQTVLIITERAVFQVTATGLELVEIAPGVDISRDILPVVQFDLRISEKVRVMEERLFHTVAMGLKSDPHWKR